jgi:hypothetical protein
LAFTTSTGYVGTQKCELDTDEKESIVEKNEKRTKEEIEEMKEERRKLWILQAGLQMG